MGAVELLLVGVGLSMDAFAVAVCRGVRMERFGMREALTIALFFGGFQALMPTLGWLLGSQFVEAIAPFDHWVIFGVLAVIGAKMVHEARTSSDCACVPQTTCVSQAQSRPQATTPRGIGLRELLLLAIATSVDALAVGVGFALMQVPVAAAVTTIGAVTFALSFLGVMAGHAFGARWQRPSLIAGGVLLMLLGVKTLAEGVITGC
ncbi:manganese efflux pump [Eggerthellaceae bacterium zg-997]|nr:manganese efflux pump [Eggerthellaceae bacterium zg-997]